MHAMVCAPVRQTPTSSARSVGAFADRCAGTQVSGEHSFDQGSLRGHWRLIDSRCRRGVAGVTIRPLVAGVSSTR